MTVFRTISVFFTTLLYLVTSTLGITAKMVFVNLTPGIYNYCPSVIEEDGTRHMYYCTNKDKFDITDHIGYRKGTKNIFGNYKYGKETIILAPSEEGAWDSRHVCDPAVVKGEFNYNGKTYGYLMAYLGCISNDCTENKVGLAVAEKPEGPFIRVGDKPFIDYVRKTDKFEWGVGQPSLLSKDKKSTVLLSYSKGTAEQSYTMIEEWDFSDLSNPKCAFSKKLSDKNIYQNDGSPDCILNADLSYDEEEKTYYILSEGHPYPSDDPNFISSYTRVTAIKESDGFDDAVHTEVFKFGTEETGYKRNHNACIVKDEYGRIDSDSITVYCSNSRTNGNTQWSYRIFEYTYNKSQQSGSSGFVIPC